MNRLKRPLALILTLCMAIGLLPSTMPIAQAAAGNSQFDSIINMEKKTPAGFDLADTTNPYGYGVDVPFLLSEQNELMLYSTYDVEYGDDKRTWTTWYDNFKPGDINSDNISAGTMELTVNSEYKSDRNAKGGFDYTNSFADTKGYSYVKAVAFDPKGTGRKDHVAYVGYSPGTRQVVTWVLDTVNNAQTPVTQLGAASWIGKDAEAGIGQYEATNFFAITAGDYKGDGKERYVVYAPLDGKNYGLKEMGYAGINKGPEVWVTEKRLLHNRYQERDEIAESTHVRDQLSVALSTGDFNNDGIDDLAVLSYMNRLFKTEHQKLDTEYYAPMLYTVLGGSGSAQLLWSAFQRAVVRKQESKTDGVTTYTTMVAPGLSCGDMDGDGRDEIVVAGYKNTVTSKKDSDDAETAFDATENKLAIVAYSLNKNSLEGTINEVDANGWLKGTPTNGFWPGTDDVWQQMGVQCVAINGQISAQHVFIGGTLYQMNGGNVAAVYTPKYFEKADVGADSFGVSVTFIASVAAGNFDGNEAGREQVVFAIGLKETGLSNNDYAYKLGILGGHDYEDTEALNPNTNKMEVTAFGPAKKYYTNDIHNNKYPIYNKGDALNKRVNCVLVAIDCDQDGLLAQYSGKSYVYSDPTILSVLQAAPWFSELGTWSDFQGSTSYGLTQSYEMTKTTGNSVSWGAGFAMDSDSGIGAKIALQTGYAGDWSESFEESISTSYTATFAAGPYDSVVLHRTPIFTYSYDVWDGENKVWKVNSMGLAVPQEPSYVQMSVDDYNAFAEYYNQYAKGKNDNITDDKKKIKPLNRLEDRYLGNEGNPWGYRKDWTNGENLSLSTYQLGYNGGSNSSSYSSGSGSTEGFEQSNGFSFSLTLQFGGKIPGANSEFWFGGYVDQTYSNSYGQYKTKAKSADTDGTVVDINSNGMYLDKGIPTDVSGAYGFSWTFGKWPVDLGGAGNDEVPILGYALTGVSAPAPAVFDLKAKLKNATDAELTWTNPWVEGRMKVDGYNVYRVEEDGVKHTKLNGDTPLAEDVTDYEVTGMDSNKTYNYVVTTVTSEGVESVWSNTASVTTPKQNFTVTFTHDDTMSVTAYHLGNVPVVSGDKVPEENIVYVNANPNEGSVITGITLSVGGETEDISLVDGKFNFVLRGNTEITFTTAPTVASSDITFQENYGYSGMDGTVVTTGKVTAEVDGIPISAPGGTVTGPVTFTAQPEEGYVLKEWQVKTNGQVQTILSVGNNILNFYPYDTAHHIEALFVEITDPSVQRKVTIASSDGGTVEVRDAKGTVLTPDDNGEISVLWGSTLSFQPKPQKHYSFTKWTDAFDGYSKEQQSIELQILNDMTVGAAFYAPVKYKVDFSAQIDSGAGGMVTAESEGVSITSGQALVPGVDITFDATADSGSRLDKWGITVGRITTFENTTGLVSNERYVLENLSANSEVKGYFKKVEECKVTFDVPENGQLIVKKGENTVNSGDVFPYGTELTVTAKPNDYYQTSSLKANGKDIPYGGKLVLTEDVTIAAYFSQYSDDGNDDPVGPGPGPSPGPGPKPIDPNDDGKTVVDEKDFDKLEQEKENDKIIIDSEKNEVELKKEFLKEADGKIKGDILIQTPVAGILLSNNALGELAALNGNITVKAKVEKLTEGVELSLAISSNDKQIEKVADGVRVHIPYTDGGISTVALRKADNRAIPLSIATATDMSVTFGGSDTVLIRDNSILKQFGDVGSHWGTNAIDFVTSHSLFKGISEDEFAPNISMDRSMLVTALHRMVDQPKVNASKRSLYNLDTQQAGSGTMFTDVAAGQWYSDAIDWAVDAGIVSGYDQKFDPQRPVTREEMAVILYRFLQQRNFTISNSVEKHFADESSVSSWAQEAVSTLYQWGIVNGGGDNNFNPQGTASRAEVAQIFKNLVTAYMAK